MKKYPIASPADILCWTTLGRRGIIMRRRLTICIAQCFREVRILPKCKNLTEFLKAIFCMKTLTIVKYKNNTHINTDMQGQDLYEALVVLHAYTAPQLKSINGLDELTKAAVSDAKKLLNEKLVDQSNQTS